MRDLTGYGITISHENERDLRKLIPKKYDRHLERTFEHGCEHDFDRDKYKFCSECGAKADVYVEGCSVYELIEECCDELGDELGLNIEWYEGYFFVGYLFKDMTPRKFVKERMDSVEKILPELGFNDGYEPEIRVFTLEY